MYIVFVLFCFCVSFLFLGVFLGFFGVCVCFFLPFFILCTLVLWTFKPWKISVDILVSIWFKRLPCKEFFFKFHFNHCYFRSRLSSRIQGNVGKTYSMRYLGVKIYPHSLNIIGQTTTKNKHSMLIIIFLLIFICIG